MVNTLFYDPKRFRSEIMHVLFKAPLTISVNGGGGAICYSHPCTPGSNPAETCVGFSEKCPCFPYSIWLDDHVNGGLVESGLKPVYRR